MTVDAFPEESGPQQGRLFAAGGPSFAEHHGRFGSLPEFRRPGALAALLDEAGADVAAPGSRRVARSPRRPDAARSRSATGPKVNLRAARTQPCSHTPPHLVLDGLILAGEAIGLVNCTYTSRPALWPLFVPRSTSGTTPAGTDPT